MSLPFDLLPRLDPLPTPPPPSSSRCLALLPEEFSLRIRSTRKRKKSSFSFCCPNRSQSRPNYQKFSAVRAEQEKDPLIADALALVLSLSTIPSTTTPSRHHKIAFAFLASVSISTLRFTRLFGHSIASSLPPKGKNNRPVEFSAKGSWSTTYFFLFAHPPSLRLRLIARNLHHLVLTARHLDLKGSV